jgi:type I site-specific deoxyribonuclease
MAIKSGQLEEKKDYQKYILEALSEDNGYQIRPATAFSAGYGMDVDVLFAFLEDTQKETLIRLEKLYKDKTKTTILNYINNEINKKNRCLLDVLKHGVEFDNGAVLHLMYRQPATSLNPKAEELYQKNVFSVMEEVYHKDDERIDLVIFLNGIAIFTFELKCNTSGQNYEDAIRQYKYERDCTTRLLKFRAGCLAHFAMDLNEVYETVGKRWGLQRGKEGSQKKHLSTVEFKAKKIIEQAKAVREESQVYADALTEAKSGNIPRKRGKLQEQVIALTADNADLSKRLTKSMDETLEYVRKAETLQKEQDNNSHYTNVGKELARTNPTEYRRIVHGKPKTIGSFFDSVLSLFTPDVVRQVPRLQQIEAEIEEERKKQEKQSKNNNHK